MLNSERISIEIRDRFHGEQIVSNEGQTRWVDYNIDYTSGTIFFKRPMTILVRQRSVGGLRWCVACSYA